MINRMEHSAGEAFTLPNVARSKEGFEFFPNENSWLIVDQVKESHFHFDELSKYYSFDFISSLKLTLIFYIENYALSHPYNMHNLFLHFTRSLPSDNDLLSSISSTNIINYKAKLGKDVWYLGSLKGFLKKWHRLRYPGIDDEVVLLLNSMRIKGNPKGNAVRTMDPVKGPFSENELLSIHEELCLKYASGAVSNRGFALAWLSMAIGQRPVQFAMAKVHDFKVIPANDGSVRYMINLPRAKQRGVEARELFSERPLCHEAGTALAVWIEQLRSADTDGIAFKELPLFPRWGHVSPIGLHHMTSQMLGLELTETINSLEVVSERTGEVIEFQSKRFKYTVGTRAAEEGHGELVIAQLLDHTDTQNVRVYVDSTAKVAGIIDKAMGPYMAPIAQAFKGMIILSDDDCPNGIRIYSGNVRKGDVGKCGHHGFCGAAAPHVCYVCVNFHPWLDGPHEDILKELSDERNRLFAITSDIRISGAKDRLIMAVTQVVDKCNEMKKLEVVNG
jgi:hypothetical protein